MRTTHTLDGRRKADLPPVKRVVHPFRHAGMAQGAYSPSYRNPRSSAVARLLDALGRGPAEPEAEAEQ